MIKIIMLLILGLIVVSGCEKIKIADNAQAFCEQKGFDDWKWESEINIFGDNFYCINRSNAISSIDKYYIGDLRYS